MLILTTAEAIRSAIGGCRHPMPVDALQRYATLFDQEVLGWIFLLHPTDSVSVLEALRGRAFEAWEYIECLGGWFEAVFILSDDGFGHVVLIPDQPDSDPDLMTICKANCS